jgi:hypothetical protein
LADPTPTISIVEPGEFSRELSASSIRRLHQRCLRREHPESAPFANTKFKPSIPSAIKWVFSTNHSRFISVMTTEVLKDNANILVIKLRCCDAAMTMYFYVLESERA